MWRYDGWGAVTRLGMLTPHADVGPESELQAMAPEGVVIHTARVPFGAMTAGGAMDPTIPLSPVRAFAEPPFVDDAAELLGAAPIAALGYAFTSSAYVLGAEDERAMVERLQERAGGIPVAAATAAAVQALRAFGLERMALVHPPWFDDELNRLGAAYFESQGFEVGFCASAELPSDQKAIDPAALHQWTAARVPDDVQGVCIGGNGFRAVGAIEAIEADLGRPVVTANQALLWNLLTLTRHREMPIGYGRLFANAPR
jgi:maleate isomerase